MSTEGRGVRNESQEPPHAQRAGDALQGCLIGADPVQAKREARVRRRALVVSTVLQAAVVLAVIAIPFFGRTERIALANVTPVPPYRPYSSAAHERPTPPGPQVGAHEAFCLLCRSEHPRPRNSEGNGTTATDPGEPVVDWGSGSGERCVTGCINLGTSDAPTPPTPTPAPKPSIVHVTHIDPALLLERIQPIYPVLPKQMHRDGRVELHAIISEDGSIESLEVVSGDALFYQSALDAVRHWRYRPTRLNGVALKVDTYITVIYTMQR